jgi:hypothetical protein
MVEPLETVFRCVTDTRVFTENFLSFCCDNLHRRQAVVEIALTMPDARGGGGIIAP